jgi:hypothetical protein
MKEKRRSSPVSPAVPTDLVILEKNFKLITSLCVLRSYQAVMCSIYTVVLKMKEETLVNIVTLFQDQFLGYLRKESNITRQGMYV